MKRFVWILGAAVLAGCGGEAPAPLYEKVAVARRPIVVSASAAGSIEPVLTVDVKSKASGEIIEMRVETGDAVRPGDLLVRVDPRQPRNNLAQADANLEVARAQLENARAQLARADTLFKAQAITEAEFENARLAYANANAQVVRAETDLEIARDAMEDTELRAPVAGIIIEKNVELGTVISSPTRDVGGGTVLFKMANLDTVQVRTLVDETDIGKVAPGMAATITVDAYPNRPFEGRVLKIEPQATVQQNVTMFPVLLRIANPDHLLKPGMNSEVEIHIGQSQDALTVPYAALRTQRDVASAATVLGLDPQAVQDELAARRPTATAGDSGSASRGGVMAAEGTPAAARAATAAPTNTMSLPDGRVITLPAGVTADQVRAVLRKRMSGGELDPAEQALMRQVGPLLRPGGGAGLRRMVAAAGGSTGAGFAGSYIVFALRDGEPTAVSIRTGLTDFDYIEVLDGLTERDTVLVLPSASLLAAQQESRERAQRMTGGGLPGVQQQPQPQRVQVRP